MNTIVKKIIVCAVLLFIGSVSLCAQVTVGADLEPVKAALLELKNYATAADSTNASKGGLVLPRVKLVDRTTLEPFIRITDREWQSTEQTKTVAEHVGLLVYNLTENNDFRQGIYVWTASGWKPMKIAPEYIYLPAFKVAWTENGTVNLYDVYKESFANLNQMATYPEYGGNAKDFYYVVTYYDNNLIKTISISETGVMSYSIPDAKDNPLPPENAYINAVMIKK